MMFQVLSSILEPIERRPADRYGTEAPDGATYVHGCVIIPALARRL